MKTSIIHTQETTISKTCFHPSESNGKVLLINGNPAITYCTFGDEQHGLLFSEENRLVIVREGILNFKCGKLAYMVGKNQMVFLKNNTLFEYQVVRQTDGRMEGTYIIFSLTQELIKEFIVLTQFSTPLKDDVSAMVMNVSTTSMQKYLDSLDPYFDAPSKVDGNLTKIKLLELLFWLVSTDNQMIAYLLDLRKNFRPNLTAIVEENLMTPLSINELAALSCRSLSSFRRDFLSIYNMPPSQWIRERRLKKAQELLRTTKMTVTDVCYTLGFENIAHFSRLFKAQFGFPPSEYRLSSVG